MRWRVSFCFHEGLGWNCLPHTRHRRSASRQASSVPTSKEPPASCNTNHHSVFHTSCPLGTHFLWITSSKQNSSLKRMNRDSRKKIFPPYHSLNHQYKFCFKTDCQFAHMPTKCPLLRVGLYQDALSCHASWLNPSYHCGGDSMGNDTVFLPCGWEDGALISAATRMRLVGSACRTRGRCHSQGQLPLAPATSLHPPAIQGTLNLPLHQWRISITTSYIKKKLHNH